MENKIMQWVKEQLGIQSPSLVMLEHAKRKEVPNIMAMLNRYLQIAQQIEQEETHGTEESV